MKTKEFLVDVIEKDLALMKEKSKVADEGETLQDHGPVRGTKFCQKEKKQGRVEKTSTKR